MPIVGFVGFCAIAWIFGGCQRRMRWSALVAAATMQFLLAGLILKTATGHAIFQVIGKAFGKLRDAYAVAIDFVLGPELNSLNSLALTILPMVIFVSALAAVLFHYRILQWVVRIFAWIFQKTMGMSGPEALAASANIFLGMAEAPTLIAPYLKELKKHQLFMVMVVGMATVSGALLTLYAEFTASFFGSYDQAAAHLLAASVVSAPASFLIARLMMPSTDGEVEVSQVVEVSVETKGFFDALTHGAIQGLKLTAYIVALLVAILGVVNFFNLVLAWFQTKMMVLDEETLVWSIENFLGKIFSPLARLMGIVADDAETAGMLLGLKVGLNDFYAYLQMASQTFKSEKTAVILSWALCGFANFGSIGIMIGSMGGICPERRSEIASLGLKAMVAGFLATCLTGTVVGLLL